MRPSDYKAPEKRGHNVIGDRVVHLPNADNVDGSEEAFTFPEWSHPDLFGNDNPVRVEYCSGNGAWIAERAQAHPDINWVAIEIKFGRTRKIWSKIKNLKLANLIVINGEGELATVHHLPKGSVDAIYINFPDPWPKRHHAKYRIIKPSFVEAMSKLLKEKGTITLVTDDPGFSDWTLKIFKGSTSFSSALPAPYYSTEWENYGNSYFKELWCGQGLSIRYHHFNKVDN